MVNEQTINAGELPDEPGVRVVNEHGDKEADGNQRENSCENAEELQRIG